MCLLGQAGPGRARPCQAVPGRAGSGEHGGSRQEFGRSCRTSAGMVSRATSALSALLVGALTAAAAVAGSTPALAATDTFTFRTTVLQDQDAYGEPSLAVAQDGHIAVCVPGGAGQTSVWYSADDGRTFGTSHTTSANGGGDCEIDFLPGGRLINVDLEIVDSAVRYSDDFGKTWQGSETAGVEQDRQWLAHTSDGKKVFLVYHDFVAEGEFYAQSSDGGLTWPTADAAIPVTGADQAAAPGIATTPAQGDPASLADQGVNTFSGPILVSPDDQDLYVLYSISNAQDNLTAGTPPFGPTHGIVVAHKGAADSAFSNNYALVDDGAVNGAIFPWGTIDKAGNVYLLYNSDKGSPGNFHTYFVVSTDKATTWSAPVKVDGEPLARGAQIYATGAAGAKGVLDVAWYGTDAANADDPAAVWNVHFAQVRGADTANPTIERGIVSPNPIHTGDICLNGLLCITGGDRSLLDFFELAIGPDGLAQIAYADNDGFDTSGGGSRGRVTWAKQTSGRSALVADTAPVAAVPGTTAPGAGAPGAGTPPTGTPSAGAPAGAAPAPGLAATGPSPAPALLAVAAFAAVALLRRRRRI